MPIFGYAGLAATLKASPHSEDHAVLRLSLTGSRDMEVVSRLWVHHASLDSVALCLAYGEQVGPQLFFECAAVSQ